jgi:hypothetical protein
MKRLANSSARRRSQARIRQVSLKVKQWTVTAVGVLTTPESALSGTVRGTTVSTIIDFANDWSGTIGDYTLKNITWTNETTGDTATPADLAYNFPLGQSLDGYFILRTSNNLETLVNGAAGHTIRIEFTLSRNGYVDIAQTATKTY